MARWAGPGRLPHDWIDDACDTEGIPSLVDSDLGFYDGERTGRLLIIFNGRKVVLFLPAALFVGFLGVCIFKKWQRPRRVADRVRAVCAAGVLVRLFKHDPMTLHTRGGHWIVSDYALSLSMNIYNTSMITWRILRQAKQTRRSGGPSISISLAIFIESAAIGIFHGFFFLGTYLAQHPSHGFAVDTAPAVYGLALAFINLRVAIGIPQKACATGDLSEIAFAQDLQRPALNVVIPLNQRGSHAEWESSQVQFDNKSPTATRV